uniref:ABC-2 type transport system permease protein n=1 Tax=Caulobacter sp. (strain K31) TaxID=366602 RepID=B0SVM2_CAUSK
MNLVASGSILWLLAHEMRLYWRNFRSGRAGKGARGLISLGVVGAMLVGGGVLAALGLHDFQVPITPLSVSLAALGGAVVFTLMLSQTLSASSEALYDRGDLDLLFSSPIGPAKVLFVRSLGVAGGVITIFALVVTPLLLPSVVYGHPGWIGLLGVLGALALAATAVGLLLAMGLFALIGPRRTRTVAQVMAALVGAGFFLASQMRTILGEQKSNSLFAEITRQAQEGRLKPPPIASLPLRAMLGEPLPLLALLAGSAALFALAALALGRRFSDAAAATQGKTGARPAKASGASARRGFAAGPFLATLRKELLLIGRDAALLSQVLLRVLYLIPTALVLSRNAAQGTGAALAGGAGVVAFLAGQVAGSLAWITLSAEEAPDLLAVSPATIATQRRAKLAAALIPVALFLALPIAVLTWFAPAAGAWTALGAALAAWSSGLINVWHQRPGKRSDFKRRGGASWMATLAEMLVSALLAGATGIAVAGFWPWSLIPLGLAGVALLSLRRSDAQIARNLRTR